MSSNIPFTIIDISDQDAEWSYKSNNFPDFEKALKNGADVNKRIRRQQYSLFEQACKTPGRSAYIAACLKKGAKVAERNPTTGKHPIHLAVESLDCDNLAELLKASDISVDVKHKGQTPLYTLLQKIDSNNYVQIFECIKLLLQHNADIMDADGSTLLALLGTLEKDGMKKRILNYCLQQKFDSLSKEVKKAVEEQFPGIEKQAKERGKTPKSVEMLWLKLAADTEEEFLLAYEKFCKKNDNQVLQDTEVRELLNVAVERNQQKAAQKLAENQLNDNGKFNGDPSFVCGLLAKCCKRGSAEMLEWLLKIIPDDAAKLINEKLLLLLLVKQIAVHTADIKSPFYSSMMVLLSDSRVDVNQIDKKGKTALHHALKYKLHHAQELLLAKGAYIGGKGLFETCLVSVMEKHLDSCITDIDCNPNDDEFEVQINFLNFAPPIGNATTAKSPNVEDEMYLIQQIAESPTTKRLLWHPVIATILMLKWKKLIYILFFNFIMCFIFAVSLTLYIVFFYGQGDSGFKPYFEGLSWIGWTYVLAREVMAIIITPQTYWQSIENIMELSLLVLSGMVLLIESSNESWSFVLIGVLLMLGIELTLQIGMLPVNSIYINMVMLKRVTKNFLKCLSFYLIILLSFTFSFYTLFRMSSIAKQHEKESAQTTAQNDNSEDQFHDFSEIPLSLVKTAVMFTGEFDAADIKFDISWPTYLLFLFFLFFVSIVINNLMNGLAVSDTSAIQADSEVVGITEMACIICRHENILKALKIFIVHTLRWKRFENSFPDLQLFSRQEPLQEIVIKPGEPHKLEEKNRTLIKRDNDTIENGVTGNEKNNGKDYVEPATKNRAKMFFNKCFEGMLDKIVMRSIEVLQSRQKKLKPLDRHLADVEQTIETMIQEQMKLRELIETLVPETENSSTTGIK